MLNPVPNLPVLIGYHRHPFTKQKIVGELEIVRVHVCVFGVGAGQGNTSCSRVPNTG